MREKKSQPFDNPTQMSTIIQIWNVMVVCGFCSDVILVLYWPSPQNQWFWKCLFPSSRPGFRNMFFGRMKTFCLYWINYLYKIYRFAIKAKTAFISRTLLCQLGEVDRSFWLIWRWTAFGFLKQFLWQKYSKYLELNFEFIECFEFAISFK